MRTGRPQRNEDRPMLAYTGIKLPPEMASALADEAKERGVSKSQVVRDALSVELAERLAASPSPAAFAAAS